MRTNGHLAGMIPAGPGGLQKTAEQINGLVERINDMGCELKDADMGLLDFRTLMDGREVYLCWKLGEEHVAYWHDMETGFAGRQPLEDASD
jgi:hypothetical protein